jgi:hypothetical protein
MKADVVRQAFMVIVQPLDKPGSGLILDDERPVRWTNRRHYVVFNETYRR